MTFNAAALLLLIAGLALIGWIAGRQRSNLLAGRAGTKLHSRPQYHGWYVALWLFAPAALFLAIWSSVSPALITNQVLTSEAAQSLPSFGFERGAILSDARGGATFDTSIGASFSTIPPTWPRTGFGRTCFFTRLTPSTTTC